MFPITKQFSLFMNGFLSQFSLIVFLRFNSDFLEGSLSCLSESIIFVNFHPIYYSLIEIKNLSKVNFSSLWIRHVLTNYT